MNLLQEFGAPNESCVDLHDNLDARCLRYTDLYRNRERPLVDYVVEHQVQALLYVVDQTHFRDDVLPVRDLQ